MRVLITGAAGNLGGMLARYLLDNTGWPLNLMTHEKPAPVDFIRIGMVPYCCDTTRMKKDRLPVLKYPTLEDGREIL